MSLIERLKRENKPKSVRMQIAQQKVRPLLEKSK